MIKLHAGIVIFNVKGYEMANDIEKVIKLLNEMQKTNDENADSFDRILTSIGSKLDMTDANANANLLKAYISELSQSVDDKYTKTLTKFEDIEKALKAVYDSQDDHVKNSDMKELFEIFSKNVNNFYTEARQEKSILAGIESKVSDLSNNKTDKQDILRTISLLRNDLENINVAYKNTIEDVNTTLKTILTSIKSIDPLKNSETTKTQIEIMFKSVNDIIARLHDIDNEYINLEKILNNVVTSDDLKVTQRIIDSIIDRTEEIEKKLDDGIQKKDLDELQQALAYINKRADWNVTKQDFSVIQEQTEDILNNAGDIKQTLSKVAQDIEKCPDASELENSLKKLYSQVNNLSENINASNVKGDIFDIGSRLNTLKDELTIIKNIISDIKDALAAKISGSIDTLSITTNDLKQAISDMLERVPLKEDIEKILNNTEEITQHLGILPEIKDNIKSSKTDIDKELSSIYDRTNSIENWLINSNIKENSEKIAAQIENTSTSDEVAQVQYRTNEIIAALEKLTKSNDIDQIRDNISGIKAKLSDIVALLDKNSYDTDIAEIRENLSNLERSVSEIVSRAEFNNFIEELKFYITKLNSNTGSCTENVEEMQRLQKKIEDKLQELDFSNTLNIIETEFDNLNQKVEDLNPQIVNISDENDKIKSELAQIKSLIEENLSELENSYNAKDADLSSIKEYLSEVKGFINGDSKSELYSKILTIEDAIVNNRTYNEAAYNEILEKIESFKNSTNTDEQLDKAVDEITALKNQIKNLEETFNNTDEKDNLYISKAEEFISEKLSELSQDLNKFANETTGKISEDFAYQSELIEQKTDLLQNLLNEIDTNKNVSNSDFTQKLSNTSESLEDFKQELQLVSTDITENFAQKSNQILEELNSIKNALKHNDSKDINTLKKEVGNLNEELTTSTEFYDVSEDLSDLYDKLTEQFAQNENNIKDFIISDTDSIIIKLDNLRDFIESSLESIIPPDAKSLKELQNFASEISEFKKQQEELLFKEFEEVKQEIKQQSDEIKSMLSVTNNNEQIIEAIESLKKSFKSYKHNTENPNDLPDYDTQGIDIDTIEDLKSDFSKYTDEIKKLSEGNEKISEVLQNIQNQLNNLEQTKDFAGKELGDDDFDLSEDDIFGNNKFDFIQAFDILQDDIRNLKSSIETIKMDNENKEGSKIPSINNGGMLININTKIDEILKSLGNHWLDDINKYIEENSSDINSKLDSINTKLDVFVSDSTNTNILNEVAETVADIAPKIDNIVPEIESLSDSDQKISSMLEELNEKISQIGTDDDSTKELSNIKNLIQEQKDYVKELEPNEKLEAFKKCLDEITFELNALATDSNADNEKLNKTIKEMKESLMDAVITIFDQVSFIEESEDIKDFVEERTDEINQNIAQITKQLQQLSSGDSSENYTYTMQDIETDLAKLRLALNEIKNSNKEESTFNEITDKLHNITSSVDTLTQAEMQELKTGINALKQQTEFLIATSDKSYNALNTGIEGFGEIVNENITGKVEKLSQMLEKCTESDRVIKQALGYIGEWIDSASESINKISTNSDEITRINEVIKSLEDLKNTINSQINGAIEDKFDIWYSQLKDFEKQFSKVENFENQLAQQQERIDRMETNIDKLINIVENLENPMVTRKIDKIDKQISKLSTNIEKLASYVD